MTRAALVTGAHVTLFDGTIVQAAPALRNAHGISQCAGCVAIHHIDTCNSLKSLCGSAAWPAATQWVFLPNTPEALAEHIAHIIEGTYETNS